MKLFILGFLLAKSVLAHEAIIGGEPVLPNGQIAQTTVMISGKSNAGEFICTGTIIDEDIIVTAAHCLKGGAANMRVIFGNQPRFIDGYIREKYADIGLIRLRDALPPGFRPAKLLSGPLHAGEPAILAGFGITNAKTGAGAGVLREVEVKIQAALGETEILVDQSNGKGACHGDSGGPAFAINGNQLLLWGVTSRAYSEMAVDDCAHGAVYTRINAYYSWIQNSIQALRL